MESEKICDIYGEKVLLKVRWKINWFQLQNLADLLDA